MTITESELSRIERQLAEVICSASDDGGVQLLAAADFSTYTLARMLREYRELRSNLPTRDAAERGHSFAEPRGSRCFCAECSDDYRLTAALG